MNLPIAENYGWESGEVEQSHSYLLPSCLSTLKAHNVKNLLDIGTGNGATLPVWREQGFNVSAMEPDKEGFEYASRHKGVDIKNLGVGDALPAEWKDHFDGITCLEVVEHLFNPHDLCDSIYYVLKKGGIGVISTPYHGYLKNLALSVFNKWDFHHHPSRVGGHIKFWSYKTITELFSKKFTIVDLKGVGRVPYMWKSMILTIQK